MKRFHVHVGVADLDHSIRFYSGLFGAAPTVRRDDYAKWMIEDPRINFAISARGGETGINHLGLQADSAAELADIRDQFAAADQASLHDEPGASCCYARSDKHWVTDPQGIAWEGYHSLGEVRFWNGNAADAASESACCMPAPAAAEPATAACCVPEAATARCAPASVTAAACCAPAKADATPTTPARCCG